MWLLYIIKKNLTTVVHIDQKNSIDILNIDFNSLTKRRSRTPLRPTDLHCKSHWFPASRKNDTQKCLKATTKTLNVWYIYLNLGNLGDNCRKNTQNTSIHWAPMYPIPTWIDGVAGELMAPVFVQRHAKPEHCEPNGVALKQPRQAIFRIFVGKFKFPRDPITETENGFMEPKYLAFRRWLYTPIVLGPRWLDPKGILSLLKLTLVHPLKIGHPFQR